MRTTLTLDDNLAGRLKEKARRERKPFKQVVNAAIRAGLHAQTAPSEAEPFRVRPHKCGFRPEVDLRRLNQLADDLEVAEFLEDHFPSTAIRIAPRRGAISVDHPRCQSPRIRVQRGCTPACGSTQVVGGVPFGGGHDRTPVGRYSRVPSPHDPSARAGIPAGPGPGGGRPEAMGRASGHDDYRAGPPSSLDFGRFPELRWQNPLEDAAPAA